MSEFAIVIARVDVCRSRVVPFPLWCWFFTDALFLTFLERVNLHPVIICTRFIST